MTRPPDFELLGRFQAHRLRAKVAPVASVESDGAGVRLDRRGRRVNVPDQLECGQEYAEVEISREVSGRLDV